MKYLALIFALLLPVQAGAAEVVDRDFIWLGAGLAFSSIFDTETTFRGLERHPNLREGNPILRPFVESGRPATYAFMFATDAAIMYLAYRAKKDGNRRWWVAPAAGIAGHTIAGGLNLRYAF